MEEVQARIKELNVTYSNKVHYLKINDMDISSSAIRDKVKFKESLKDYVPDKVERYIYENKLYQ